MLSIFELCLDGFRLELFIELEILLIFEKRIRGGLISQ